MKASDSPQNLMFQSLSVCCGCKMNLATASQVAFLVSNTKNTPLITTISLATLQQRVTTLWLIKSTYQFVFAVHGFIYNKEFKLQIASLRNSTVILQRTPRTYIQHQLVTSGRLIAYGNLRGSCPAHPLILQPQYTNPQNILWMSPLQVHFKVAVRNFNALNESR